ncbi:hypothetical protein [Streptomyces sp. ZSW22]|uniref:hypothetical protein n=1 Tax=Streptomyces sp. ZSW22 TaxID=3055050 RepID=UPI0025B005AC|nr:hypothetical protein [Streptomyces sp. ZSW22]MDN3244102.1 hypothetical protein [Streptomyces sp. ZSW22]
MPVTRARYEALKNAHAALKQKFREVSREQQNHSRTDRLTADTITRLHDETTALRGIVAALILQLEGSGRYEDATALRRQLLGAGLDLTEEIGARAPLPGARLARRQYTPAEAALRADLRRAREALGAMEARCLEVQRVNDAQDVMLREAADRSVGSAA